jgi:hypothetical protein
MPNRAELEAKLKAFPGWTWKAWGTKEFIKNQSESAKRRAAAEPKGYRSKLIKQQHANMSKEKKEARNKKISAVQSTPEARKKTSERFKQQCADRHRKEIPTARAEAVDFIKSQEARKKLREKYVAEGKKLYMIHTDKHNTQTIRRVNNLGGLAGIVCDVVYVDEEDKKEQQQKAAAAAAKAMTEARDAQIERKKQQDEKRLLKEISKARAEAVDFIKSQEARKKLREKYVAEGKKLYMKYTDKHGTQTIRRVQKSGALIGIVCDVVYVDEEEKKEQQQQ